jgi:hypothetical protein
MLDWAIFIDAYDNPYATFSYVVAYWQTFDKACPKHDPSKNSIIAKLVHETTKFKMLCIGRWIKTLILNINKDLLGKKKFI